MTQTQYKLKHFMLWDSPDLIWSSVQDAMRTRMLPCFNLKFCLGYLGSILSHCFLILKKPTLPETISAQRLQKSPCWMCTFWNSQRKVVFPSLLSIERRILEFEMLSPKVLLMIIFLFSVIYVNIWGSNLRKAVSPPYCREPGSFTNHSQGKNQWKVYSYFHMKVYKQSLNTEYLWESLDDPALIRFPFSVLKVMSLSR